MIWTDKTEALVTRLFLEGLTGLEIADRLGLTRAAVLGKLHRLGIRRPHLRSAKPVLLPAVRLPGVDLLELGPYACRFILDPYDRERIENVRYCGERIIEWPWCKTHYDRCVNARFEPTLKQSPQLFDFM